MLARLRCPIPLAILLRAGAAPVHRALTQWVRWLPHHGRAWTAGRCAGSTVSYMLATLCWDERLDDSPTEARRRTPRPLTAATCGSSRTDSLVRVNCRRWRGLPAVLELFGHSNVATTSESPRDIVDGRDTRRQSWLGRRQLGAALRGEGRLLTAEVSGVDRTTVVAPKSWLSRRSTSSRTTTPPSVHPHGSGGVTRRHGASRERPGSAERTRRAAQRGARPVGHMALSHQGS